MSVISRSPAVAFLAIASVMACQLLCRDAGYADSAAFHDTAHAASDPCCNTDTRPTDESDDSDCCLLCCCHGAVLTKSVASDQVILAAVLPLSWLLPDRESPAVHPDSAALASFRPPGPPLNTVVLLI